MIIDTRCPFCGTPNHICITEKEYERWNGGELVQKVFPDMTPEERELLITGICEKCWNDTFGDFNV